MTSACSPARFDDRQVHWMPFGDLPHFLFSILHIADGTLRAIGAA